MSQPDWAKIYAAMDKRISLKYEQLPRGEQIGKSPQRETRTKINPDRLVVSLGIWFKVFSADWKTT
jgi:hypothetical protein